MRLAFRFALIVPLVAHALAGSCSGQTLDCDAPLTTTIDVPGQVNDHALAFGVTDGEIVAVNVQPTTGPSFAPRWRLLDKNGAPVADPDCDNAQSGYGDCGPLPASGNPYRIEVSESGGNDTGTYEVTVERLTAAAACEALSAPCNAAVTSSLNHRTETNLHQLGFDVDPAGTEIVSIDVIATAGANFAPRWRLLDAAGVPVSDPDCNGSESGYGDCGPLPASGNPYRIQIVESGSNDTGSYELFVQRLGASTACEAIAAPCDGIVTKTLAAPTDNNLHQLGFSLTDGEIVAVNVQAIAGTNFGPRWRLLDATGVPVGDPDCDNAQAGYGDCGPLPASGNPYRVQVTDSGTDGTGSYEITVERLTAAGACEALTVPCGAAVSASLSNRTEINLHQLGFDVDPAGTEIVSVDVVATAGASFDPRWRLLDAAGVAVSDPDCNGSESGYGDCGPLPASGNPYRIQILENGSNDTGSYELFVQRLAAADACDAIVAPCDATVSQDLTARTGSHLHQFGFSIADGEIVGVNVQPTAGGAFAPRWRLLDASGIPVVDPDCDNGQSGYGDCGPLPAAGNPYRVQVTESGTDDTGSYQVAIERLTATGACETAPECRIGTRTDTDLFEIRPPVADNATIGVNVTATGGAGFDPRWRLLDREGKPVADTDCDGGATGSQSCGPLPASGNPYRVQVTENGFNNLGTMSVQVDGVSLCCGNGSLDVGEACDNSAQQGPSVCCNSSCAVATPSTICRPSAGICDVAETCGGSGVCPADAVLSSSVICRASAGVCDVAEHCDGTSVTCPSDTFASASTVCRAAAGVCDVSEHCTGSSAACPADAVQSANVVCRPATGVCDVAEACTGSSSACPADTFAAATVSCRATAGPCDVGEFCTGSSADCPADGSRSPQTICRPAAGICDVAESCTGADAACPPDAFQSTSTVCRPAAGLCDLAETCTGSSSACPADAVATAGASCRDAAGSCDVAETCDGSGIGCPTDAFLPAGAACEGPAAECRTGGACRGDGPTCEAGSALPDGSGCADPTCDPSPGTCTGGTCHACAGDARVAGAPARVDVVCTLEDLSGGGVATCTAEGHLLPVPAPTATSDDSCVPGCPNLANRKLTKLLKVRFRNDQQERRLKLPVNSNGRVYLNQHGTIEMGVCITVTDKGGRVRRKECATSVTKPIRKPRH